MLEILGIVAILAIAVVYAVGHINISVTHKHMYEPLPEINQPEMPSTFKDPGYNDEGDPVNKEEEKHSIDSLLSLVNGIMLDEEDRDE